ncbi:MAG: alkaline phosphatase family protein [Moorea sp. SIO2B7]|nr:alkaline phosphatase family protein [Moorena sp. SIO2B7]
MINEESLQIVASARLNQHIGKPLYDSYCFSQIPQMIYHLLTGDSKMGLPTPVLGDLPHRYDKVILILVDGFGWRFFEEYLQQSPFLKRFAKEGVVSKLTTQFPSTTAAHVTTIHSGLPVASSGIYEWFYYEPLLDDIIAPLMFSFAGDQERNTLQKTGICEQKLFPNQTLYHQLQQHGVKSYCFQHQNYAHSPFTRVVCDGAQLVSYKTVPEALVNLSKLASEKEEKGYFFLYVDSIDSIGHRYSPSSPQLFWEVNTFLSTMEQLFHSINTGKLKNTLLLITADHGQIEVSPQTTIYLNQILPQLQSFMKTNSQNKPLVPAGSPRDMFLHIQEEYLEHTYELLSKNLTNKAMVYRTKTLIDEGYFGSGNISQLLRNRLGNLVILPYKQETVWWYVPNRFEQLNFGHHGGLSCEEMETVLLALEYS